jgi:hypothetical protein
MLRRLVGEWVGGGVGGDEGSLSQWPNTRDRKVENCEYDVVSTRRELSNRTSCDKLYIRTTLLRRVHYLINAKLCHVTAYLTECCHRAQFHRRSSTTMLHNTHTIYSDFLSALTCIWVYPDQNLPSNARALSTGGATQSGGVLA